MGRVLHSTGQPMYMDEIPASMATVHNGPEQATRPHPALFTDVATASAASQFRHLSQFSKIVSALSLSSSYSSLIYNTLRPITFHKRLIVSMLWFSTTAFSSSSSCLFLLTNSIDSFSRCVSVCIALKDDTPSRVPSLRCVYTICIINIYRHPITYI